MNTLIISGGSFNENFLRTFIKNKKYDYVIAVDKGLLYARALEINPDLIVGDFDSMDKTVLENYNKSTVRIFLPEKDDTDTEIAIREAVKHKGDIDIICATGGRIDHLLGNIHVLKIALDAGVNARIIDECNVVFLKNSDFELKKEEWNEKYVSFIPFDGEVKGIKLKGFKYLLDGYDLKPGITKCISNEIAEDNAYVEMESGCLIVVISLDIETE